MAFVSSLSALKKVLFTGAVVLVAAVVVLASQSTALADTDDTRPSLLVDFQDKDAATPKDYKADHGLPYSADRGHGWLDAEGKPLSLVGNGRDRNLDPDQRLDTLINMQLKPGSAGVATPGRWRGDVANGLYSVTVAAGDAGYTDSRHVVRVEGKQAIDFTPTAARKFATETVTVDVADGNVEIDAVGGDNTKLAYVDIRPVVTAPAPTTPPASRAYKINFAPRSAAAVEGYQPDTGETYSTARGFGWETVTGGPLDLSAETRKRNKATDPRLDSFVHMQSGRAPEGRWQLDVANGAYQLTFGLGDPDYGDSQHQLRAEGVVAGTFVPSSKERTKVLQARVDVTDGKLTVDQVGGKNTKLDFIDAVPIAAGPAPAPAPTPVPAPKTDHKIRFAPLGSAAVTGYTNDSGQTYDAARGFGWEAATGGPIDLTSEARERNSKTDKRLDGFVHMQSGRKPEGRWQLDLPNGTYNLSVGVGDPDYIDSRHLVRAEGVPLGELVPTSAVRNRVFQATVVVDDGKLTLDQSGGRNTKINFAEVSPVTVPTPAPTPPARLAVSTPHEYLGLGKRLVFTTVNNIAQPAQLVTVTNTGGTAAEISSITFSGPQAASFRLADGQPSTFTVAPNDTLGIAIVFTPIAQETNSATLNVNGGTAGLMSVSLGGMNARNFEDVYEPSLQAIFDSLGYKVSAGVTNEYTNFISKSNDPVGDEVASPYWKRADASKPVGLYPLASYSGRNSYSLGPAGLSLVNQARLATTGYYLAGGTDQFGGENQRLLPKPVSGSAVDWAAVPEVFGFTFGGNYSDRTLNSNAQLHNVRTYPAKDATGAAIKNTYLVSVDQGLADCCWKNFDYQEGVFLATNVEPSRLP